MALEYELFDPRNLTRDEWKLYHEFRKIRFAETNPDDPVQPDEVIEKSLIQDYTNGLMIMERYMVKDYINGNLKMVGSGVVAGFTEKNPSYETNKHLAMFNIALLKEYRRKGLGTKVLPYFMNFAKNHNITSLVSSVSEEDGKEFLQHIGATLAMESKENRLQVDEINWEMVQDWIKEGVELNKTTKLITCNEIPEELIEQYAKFYTEVMNQQPLGELEVDDMIFTPETIRVREAEFKQLGFSSYTMMTIEEDGMISGMTEMIWMPGKDTMLNQGLTGVRKSQRGRKLGKWLKAAMIKEMKDKYPQVKVITTGNADSNAPMLSINHRLGFKGYKETNMGQIALKKLEKYYTSKQEIQSTTL